MDMSDQTENAGFTNSWLEHILHFAVFLRVRGGERNEDHFKACSNR